MKKIILLLTVLFTMVCSSMAFAADGGALNKQQAAAEPFIQSFGSAAPLYADAVKGFSADLKGKVNEQNYDELKKQVKEKFGTLKESKFYSYQRFDEIDYVTYIASFSKEKLVSIMMAFDKKNKMLDFALTPMPQSAAQGKQDK